MTELIATYLQDHHAGSSTGVDAFGRVAEYHSDERVRSAVGRIADEVEADQQSLEQIMALVGAKTSTIKDVAGKVGEKVTRLKLNDRLTDRSPLSDVVELEALVMAVHGKGLLWEALLELDDPRLDRAQLQRLSDRAESQRQELDHLRLTQVHKLRQE